MKLRLPRFNVATKSDVPTSRSLTTFVDDVVKQSKDLAGAIQTFDDTKLRLSLGRLIDVSESTSQIALATACFVEAVRRSLGLTLFESQIQAGVVISSGGIAEMQTGEGKTMAVALAAYLKSLDGRGVHVATPNRYLACRDRDQLADTFSRLGMTTAFVDDDDDSQARSVAYQADVTYAAGHTFGFDHLRDQASLSMAGQSPIGSQTLARLRGVDVGLKGGGLIQRGLVNIIIDEIDHVLIDDAVSPLILGTSTKGEATDAELHLAAFAMAGSLRVDRDYVVGSDRSIEWTTEGFKRVHLDTTFSAASMLLVRGTITCCWLCGQSITTHAMSITSSAIDRSRSPMHRPDAFIRIDLGWMDCSKPSKLAKVCRSVHRLKQSPASLANASSNNTPSWAERPERRRIAKQSFRTSMACPSSRSRFARRRDGWSCRRGLPSTKQKRSMRSSMKPSRCHAGDVRCWSAR